MASTMVRFPSPMKSLFLRIMCQDESETGGANRKEPNDHKFQLPTADDAKNVACKKTFCEVSLEDPLVVVAVVVSHIQRIGCQPEKNTLHGGQSRSWSAEQGKENKKRSLAAYPPPTPHIARSE